MAQNNLFSSERPNIFRRFSGYIHDYGILTTAYLIKRKLKQKKAKPAFDVFIEETEKDIFEITELEYKPLFSFVVPVYNVEDWQLRACIDSILNQTYDNFELILVDDNSSWDGVHKVLAEYEENPKITVIYRKENGHICRSTNTGIEKAAGEYIVFSDCDDVVSPNAVYEMTKAVNHDRSIDFIYSDEDKLSNDGKKRHFPHFKPDWSPDTFMSLMYTSHLAAYRTSIVKEFGGLRVGFEGAQDYDFTARFTEITNKIYHIPKILYHWRERPESTASNSEAKPYVKNATLTLKKEALERRGLKGEVIYLSEVNQYRIVYEAQDKPLVSIIIPSKDNFEYLERCLNSLTEKTNYKNYEIIVVDNGSSNENKDKYSELCKRLGAYYHYEKMDFNFSRMCNNGARLAKGSYYLFLNDDIEIIEENWLNLMVGQASLNHSGAIGAKLLYPENKLIQHCGIINISFGPCHAFLRFSDEIPHYFSRNKLEYNYIAVTGACLCISKEKFELVNGFDEALAVGYNDVDLCLKLFKNGYYNTVRSDAVLYHHESISRGIDSMNSEKTNRLLKEKNLLYSKHPEFAGGYDPFYSPNFLQNNIDFSIGGFNKFNKIVAINHKLTESEEIHYSIDSFFASDERVYIEGWIFSKKFKLNNLNRKFVVLIGTNGNNLILETEAVIRRDISLAFNSKHTLNLSGFRCSIDCQGLSPDSYKIGLLITNPACPMGNFILSNREFMVIE